MLPNSAFSKPLALLIGWTLFVWTSRTRNVVGNDQLSVWATTWRLGVVVVFVSLAGLALVGRLRGWLWLPRLVAVLVWWTVGYWLIRGTGIIIDDHETGFVIVHTVLMAVSIGLAGWVWVRRSC